MLLLRVNKRGGNASENSIPWGYKIKRLAVVAKQHNLAVDSIDYTDTMEPNVRVGSFYAGTG